MNDYVIILISLLLIGGLFGIANLMDSISCDKQTMSFKSHEYSLFGGCIIELKNGDKIPLDNYRSFQ